MKEQNAEPVRLYCGDFNSLAGCCDSCHADYDTGYDQPIDLEHEDSPLIPAGAVAFVCCSKMIALEAARIDGSGAA